MTFEKMQRVMQHLLQRGVSGFVLANSEGLALNLRSQPEKPVHDWLISQGFVVATLRGFYVYAPGKAKTMGVD
jgi:hypothetical protein